MNEVLANINLMEVLTTVWTVVLVPILTYLWKQVNKWMESKQIDKYGAILYNEVVKAVKCVYETEVKDIKKTADWTSEKQLEVKELAKAKAIQALSNTAYKCLKEANGDFDSYLDSLIGTALYDVKHESKE